MTHLLYHFLFHLSEKNFDKLIFPLGYIPHLNSDQTNNIYKNVRLAKRTFSLAFLGGSITVKIKSHITCVLILKKGHVCCVQDT